VLITIEGIDGSGKSSLVKALRDEIADLTPLFTREPGATWIGEQVRRGIAEEIDPIAEALLFVADHAAHIATIVRPALSEGRIVISDRYSDSRYAYQAVTLAAHLPDPMGWLQGVHDGWTIRPDRTFLLILPVEVAISRLASNTHREHFERAEVLGKVQQEYLEIAAKEPGRFVLIDATKEKGEIVAFIAAEIRRSAAP
jgi:dTMP kinase